jgi:quercetin dioxygenase-like cupin family protein
LDGQPHAVHKGHMVRVGPGVRRKLTAGPAGMQVLTIGGVPDKGFEPNW